jgi:hypothetical protein
MAIFSTNRNFGTYSIAGVHKARQVTARPQPQRIKRVAKLMARDLARERPPVSLPKLNCLATDDDPHDSPPRAA